MMDGATFERVMYCLEQEIRGSQDKFPGSRMMPAVIGEEFGEVCNALLEHSRGNLPNAAVFKECIQLAAMALRLAMEGDPEYPYAYDYNCYRDFKPTGSHSLKELVIAANPAQSEVSR